MWKLDKSIVGKKFCSLTVLDDYIQIPKGNGSKTLWKVRCDCGNEFYLYREALLHRKVMYCDKCRPNGIRHEDLYHLYYGIKQRCYNEKSCKYNIYGGKGVKMCDEWLDSYGSFKAWSFAHGYQPGCGLTIDRIDSDGDYCPENCQWITRRENSARANYGRVKNHSKLKDPFVITPSGERIELDNISKFCRDYGLNKSNVFASLHGRIGNVYEGYEFHSDKTRS